MKGKKILLGITGGIAAYKSALLLRLLVKAGAEVQVVFTPAAKDFVTPLTFSTLSGKPVLSALIENDHWVNHVKLGIENDLLLIAPASANTLSKLANGICDNLLTAVYLSARCPVWIAPAMDLDMLQHPSVQRNITTLKQDGAHVLESGTGDLASGLVGKGRMQEPEEIFTALDEFFHPKIHKLKALVTAGPTFEAIDPVRFVGNHSTGKMGLAIAKSLHNAGFEVILVAGPGVVLDGLAGISLIQVQSSEEMYLACKDSFKEVDVCVMAAAVADYKPSQVGKQKLKKKEESIHLELTKTTDILASLGKEKSNKQLLIGFALETENGVDNAKEKMLRKNCDIMLLNSPEKGRTGFGSDTNQLTVISNNKVEAWSLMTKQKLADKIVRELILDHFKK